MGAGKSTIARHIGLRLGLPWIDLDYVIQRKEGLSIRDIFTRYGENGFREMEAKSIQDLISPSVVSLGGGSFVQGNIREYISSKGVSIHLWVPFSQIWKRVSGKKQRPLVHGFGELLFLYQQRLFFYQLADHTVVLTGLENSHEVAECVIEQLRLK